MLPYHKDHDSVRYVLKAEWDFFPHVWEYIDEIFCNISFYDLRIKKKWYWEHPKWPSTHHHKHHFQQSPLLLWTTSAHTCAAGFFTQAPSRHLLPLSHFLTTAVKPHHHWERKPLRNHQSLLKCQTLWQSRHYDDWLNTYLILWTLKKHNCRLFHDVKENVFRFGIFNWKSECMTLNFNAKLQTRHLQNCKLGIWTNSARLFSLSFIATSENRAKRWWWFPLAHVHAHPRASLARRHSPSSPRNCCYLLCPWSRARSWPSSRRSARASASSRVSSRSPWWSGQRTTCCPRRYGGTSCSSSAVQHQEEVPVAEAAAAAPGAAAADGDDGEGEEEEDDGVNERRSPPGNHCGSQLASARILHSPLLTGRGLRWSPWFLRAPAAQTGPGRMCWSWPGH